MPNTFDQLNSGIYLPLWPIGLYVEVVGLVIETETYSIVWCFIVCKGIVSNDALSGLLYAVSQCVIDRALPWGKATKHIAAILQQVIDNSAV